MFCTGIFKFVCCKFVYVGNGSNPLCHSEINVVGFRGKFLKHKRVFHEHLLLLQCVDTMYG